MKWRRSSGFWVVTPSGQVFKLHLRIMTHPSTMSSNVPKPNSSAPSNDIIIMSRPVFNWPSTCSLTCPRRPFFTSVCCVSLMPISGEMPAKRMLDAGLAPVPPSAPDITMRSALALATPAAMVPTPLSATSLTLIAAFGLTFFRSNISCARSSMEYMSWWGGGEISDIPGIEWRVLAITSSTLKPGSWPPSPGFAPCATLICISSAFTRYSVVTPKRPDATCFVLLESDIPSIMEWKRSLSSPPSPVLERVPSLFMASAMASCASLESAPKLIAPATKCFTMALTGSTLSMFIGVAARLKSKKSRMNMASALSSTSLVNSLYFL
ncbi:putative uncharacterized protein [Prevotella sp. CAG:1124]|nr:putative uncharacterized protein [Prevotella sp. CAG:1124]